MNSKQFSKAMNEIDNKYVEEAVSYQVRKKNPWMKRAAAAAACLILMCAAAMNCFPHTEDDTFIAYGDSDAPPMVYVNDKLYQESIEQVSYDEIKSEFIYLGKIESDLTSSQAGTDGIPKANFQADDIIVVEEDDVPKENFQANLHIVGAEVYQYNEDIVVQIDGKYWLYEVIDNETSNDTQNELSEEEKMQLDPSYP